MSQITILCVDPDPDERDATTTDLREHFEDAEVLSAGSLSSAERLLTEEAVNCVVTEYELPDGTGLELTDRVRGEVPDTGCFLYTSADPGVLRDDAHEETIAEYVSKDGPDAIDQLASLVEATVALHAQTSYPLPQDEAERVAALESYDLAGEELEATVERVTDLAAMHFDVPKASVNIIRDHTQEFLACHGSEWTPTEREDSICTYALLDDDAVTFVEDAREDPRFADNEELRDLGIRSYAGAALETPGGFEIGTLCVYDDEPRSFTDEEEAFLDTLADVTMSLLELHREADDAWTDPERARGEDG